MGVGPNKQAQEWTRWISALLDESISEQDFDHLSELLRNNREARKLYRRAVDIDFAVEEEADMGVFDCMPTPRRRSLKPLILVGAMLASAAALVIALRPQSAAMPAPVLLEQVQATWADHYKLADNGKLPVGQSLTLTSGAVSIELAPNIEAVVRGPATFRVDHSFLDLASGRASIITHDATVRVQIPHANIINFGTEFAVRIDDEQTQLYIFDGMVEANLNNGESSVRAGRGQGLLVDGARGLIQRENLDPADFRFAEMTEEPVLLDYSKIVASDGASHHWRFDNDEQSRNFSNPAGSTLARAAEGNGTLSLERTRPTDYQANFMGAIPSLFGAGTTIEFWVKHAEGFDGRGAILSITDPSVGIGSRHLFMLEFQNANNTRRIRSVYRDKSGAKEWEITAPLSFEKSNWHHLVLVRDGAQLTLFMDGARVGQRSVPEPTIDDNKTLTIHVGHLGGAKENPRWFKGQIDELAIYPTALTARQIRLHFELGNDLFK